MLLILLTLLVLVTSDRILIPAHEAICYGHYCQDESDAGYDIYCELMGSEQAYCYLSGFAPVHLHKAKLIMFSDSRYCFSYNLTFNILHSLGEIMGYVIGTIPLANTRVDRVKETSIEKNQISVFMWMRDMYKPIATIICMAAWLYICIMYTEDKSVAMDKRKRRRILSKQLNLPSRLYLIETNMTDIPEMDREIIRRLVESVAKHFLSEVDNRLDFALEKFEDYKFSFYLNQNSVSLEQLEPLCDYEVRFSGATFLKPPILQIWLKETKSQ